MKPRDHQPPRKRFDAEGKAPEHISEFFDFSGEGGDEKGNRKVRRFELLAVLTQIERGKQELKLHRRLWRWVTSHMTWKQTGMANPTEVPTVASIAEAGVTAYEEGVKEKTT